MPCPLVSENTARYREASEPREGDACPTHPGRSATTCTEKNAYIDRSQTTVNLIDSKTFVKLAFSLGAGKSGKIGGICRVQAVRGRFLAFQFPRGCEFRLSILITATFAAIAGPSLPIRREGRIRDECPAAGIVRRVLWWFAFL